MLAGLLLVLASGLLTAAGTVSDPLDPAHCSMQAHAGAARLLAAETINLMASGTFELDYNRGLLVLQRAELIDDVQAAYADMLPEGQPPEFVVEQIEPGHYAYVNRKGQRSRVEVLYQEEAAPGDFMMVIYASGERWFGPFRSLIRVRVQPSDVPGTCHYRAEIDAYPESALLRGLVRIGPVYRYFDNKTKEMVGIVLGVAGRL